MEYAMELRDLRKEYKEFTLDNISLSLPMGCIMGFIGENCAVDVYKRQATESCLSKWPGKNSKSVWKRGRSTSCLFYTYRCV